MVLRNDYRYVAEALDPEGRRLGDFLLTPDFTAAAECLHLEGVRRGKLPALAHHGPGVVEPIFDQIRGRPYVSSIGIRFDAADLAEELPAIPWSYFQPLVETGSAQLVKNGTIRAGENFAYQICALPANVDHRVSAADSLTAGKEIPVSLDLEQAPLAWFLEQATCLSPRAWCDIDFPVFVRPEVLAEATELACAAGESETGGILIGHLRRDTETPELHAEITAQIPAAHADAGPAHLGFNPDTWSAVSDALALRRRNEIWIGWWHSHPDFCRHCDPARRSLCVLSRPFFSRDDCELHRTVFDTAFSIALLLSNIGEALPRCDWFGWRNGGIAARGCYLLPGNDKSTLKVHADDGSTPARVLSIQENHHEY